MNDVAPRRLRRLPDIWIDGGRPMYFITLCTLDRKRVLNSEEVYNRFLTFIDGSYDRYGWWLSCYVVMPDHIHLFARCGPGDPARQGCRPGDPTRRKEVKKEPPDHKTTSLGEWIKAMKSFVGNREFRWQKSFFDHVLRSDESFSEKWEYIRMNPIRAGLVEEASTWKYWGAYHSLDGMACCEPPREVTQPTTEML